MAVLLIIQIGQTVYQLLHSYSLPDKGICHLQRLSDIHGPYRNTEMILIIGMQWGIANEGIIDARCGKLKPGGCVTGRSTM